MNATTQAAPPPPRVTGPIAWRKDVAILSLGVLLMFSPTLYRLLGTTDAALWQSGEHSHGPIMLVISLWLLHKRWTEHSHSQASSTEQIDGQWYAWPTLVFGTLSFMVGRALGIIYLEYGAIVPITAGVILLSGGTSLLKATAFPVFFLVFSVPLPGFLVDPVSQFLKHQVSVVTTEVLWHAGYPIANSGVVLTIGQYQLLVADACAGMRTLFMLEAMGIFYINVVKHASLFRNITLATLIVPISFASNCIRVIFLALLTYHFGDEVGQGFLHGFAGIVLFIVAFILTISLDGLLRLIDKTISKKASV